jgi:hypothetical protein
MRNKALYFPYIEVPNNKWLVQVLLYWDKLSSIVPMEYIYSPEKLTPHMRELVSAELVEQIVPIEHLHTIENFEENFIKCIENRIRIFNKPIGLCANSKLLKSSMSAKIHIEKLGELPKWLEQNGLATHDHYPWLNIEPNVANMFMSYLSAVLGGLPSVDATPITDNLNCANILGHSSSPRLGNNKNQIRSHILRKILPIPSSNISLDSLLKFKDKYKKLLPKFRELIETYCTELATIPNGEQRKARLETVTLNLKQQGEEIEDAIRTSWNDITFKSLAPLLASGGALSGSLATGNPLAIGTATVSFIAAAYSSLSSVQRPQAYINKPLAYYVLAKKELIKA